MIGLSSSEKMSAFIKKAEEQSSSAKNTPSMTRLTAIFDPGSFVSIDSQVVSRPFSDAFDRPPVDGDGVVTGYGTVDGRLVYAAAQDPSVYGGSVGRAHAMKIVKSLELAIRSGAPFLLLFSSGGARIEEGILSLEGMGALLSSLSEAKGIIPLIGGIYGACPGGLALAAAQFDFLVFLRSKGGLYMNSPAVTAFAEGNSADPALIGSAQDHERFTGLASVVAADEEEAATRFREILAYIPVQTGTDYSFTRELSSDDPNRVDEKLNAIAENVDSDGVPVGTILASVADFGESLELSAEYGSDILTAFIRLDGLAVGVVASREVKITEAGAKKAASFVRFCTSFMIPIVTITNASGFAIGAASEKSGILSAASDLVTAFAGSDVPRIGLIAGKAIGTAYLALNSKILGADIVYAWPTAEIAVMEADTAANVLFAKDIASASDPQAAREEKVRAYRDQISDPSVAAGLGQIDEIILPSATRARLISALDMLLCSYPLIDRS